MIKFNDMIALYCIWVVFYAPSVLRVIVQPPRVLPPEFLFLSLINYILLFAGALSLKMS